MKSPQNIKNCGSLKRIFTMATCCFILVPLLLTIGVKDIGAKDIGAFIPGKGWVVQQGSCDGDSTPLQFIPKTPRDSSPLISELKKYPRCVHCGMNRMMWHHSRHLVQYDDDLVVGTCSIRCLGVNLSLNLDRGVKVIWVADYGDQIKPKTLILADTAIYLTGSKLKGTMTHKSKMAFSLKEKARSMSTSHGGALVSFEEALKAAYNDMGMDTIMIRKRRAEKQKKMKQKTE